jgi:hypothetical protein
VPEPAIPKATAPRAGSLVRRHPDAVFHGRRVPTAGTQQTEVVPRELSINNSLIWWGGWGRRIRVWRRGLRRYWRHSRASCCRIWMSGSGV